MTNDPARRTRGATKVSAADDGLHATGGIMKAIPAGVAPGDRRPRRHWRRVVIAVAAIGLVGAAVFTVLWRDTGARPVSTEEARRRFSQSSSTQPPNTALLRPPAGVYLYRGNGTERLSVPPKSQAQGPTMPGTVTHGADGCWTFRIDYSNHHWQSWRYCARNGGLVDRGGQTFAAWDFVVFTYDNTADFTCDPPSIVVRARMDPGDEWMQRCEGTNSAVDGVTVSEGPYTYVGEESVDVGGTSVPAYHFRQRRELSGGQTGSNVVDMWFARDNGLPLRNERKLTVHADTIAGKSTYTEDGRFRLTSLTPQR
jgi:hypothetical protein